MKQCVTPQLGWAKIRWICMRSWCSCNTSDLQTQGFDFDAHFGYSSCAYICLSPVYVTSCLQTRLGVFTSYQILIVRYLEID